KTDRLRAINEPQRVEVELDANGLPVGMRDAGCEMRVVEDVGEIWRIDDEWWRMPIVRRYVEVILEGGGRVVLFEDLMTGEAFAQEAKQLGLQAITGAELTLLDGSHVTLLAETPEGYANLCRLITEAHLGREDRRDPRLDFDSLEARHAGLIVLSGCRNGLLPQVLRRDGPAAVRRVAERCRAVFGKDNFVVELQRNYVRGDLALTRALKDVADSVRLSVVASGNVHYHKRERHRLHDVLVAIRHRTTLDGSHNVRHANSEFFLRPPHEVEELFRDCPDAVANTLALAERCRGFDLTRDLGYRFPDFNGAERAPAP